jgi:hypothetical protein
MSDDIDFQKFLENQRASRAAEAARDKELRDQKAREKDQAIALWPKLVPTLQQVINDLQATDLYDLELSEVRAEGFTVNIHFALVGKGGSRAYKQRNGNGAMQLTISEGCVKLNSRAYERSPMNAPLTPIPEFSDTWLKSALRSTIKKFFQAQTEGRAL